MISVNEIDSELTKKLETDWLGEYVKISDDDDPRNFCILPRGATKSRMEKIIAMKVYEDDVWVITNPKCGTTLMQEMAWLIVNDLNFESAQKIIQDKRVPFVEFGAFTSGTSSEFESLEVAQNLSRPRVIKSHLPVFLLPKELFTVKPRIIYVARNPNDAAVSFYHQHVHLHGWKNPNLDTFIEAFVKDLNFYSPFNDHVLKFWEMRHEPNVFITHYEDLRRNLKSIAEKTSKFLGKSFSSEDLEKLCDYVSFEKMKDNKSANKADIIAVIRKGIGREGEWKFIRKGKVGSYKEELTEKQIEWLDEYVKAFEAQTDFRFKFE